MKNSQKGTVAAGILALVLVFSPLAGVAGGILVSQVNSYSRIESVITGYVPGGSAYSTVLPVPQPSVNFIPASASDRIASLLYSDIESWTPPEDRVYNMDPPVHLHPGDTSRMSWDDFFFDPPDCGCCG